MFGTAEVIKEMLDAGISGYILKNTGRLELLAALDKVIEGENYFDQQVIKEILNNFTKNEVQLRLTNRKI
ncbi:MAG: response regulator transcription factor [Pedobacter sp.]|nr:response regulator transcription factor [Pedobacter sp.]